MTSLTPKSEAARRRPVSVLQLKLWEIAEQLEQQLDDPAEMLEMLVSSAAKGEQAPDTWAKLHEAASRFDKTTDLALAYQQVTLDKRIKLLPAEQQAFIFLQAAHFFADVFQDADGGVSYAERAIAAVPTDAEAFVWLERLLTGAGRLGRLAELYVEASEREASLERRCELLRRAHVIALQHENADALAIDVGKRLLKLDGNDERVRDDVMQRLLATGRHSEVVELLEQALERAPAPGPEEAKLIREQLVDLCFSVLKSPERALMHVEGILKLDPLHVMALQAAQGLLEDRLLMSRAAAALSDAFEAAGDLERAVAMLTSELKQVRGPRRMEVQRRLGILRQDVLNDAAGALELLGPVVAGDPGDDDLRARFVALNSSLNLPEQAARLLSRALQTHRDPGVRARVGLDVGHVYLKAGDVQRAQAAFQKVLEAAADDKASLAAARQLAELYAESGQLAELGAALEVVVRFEVEKEARQAAARRLARLCDGEVPDTARAILAFRALIGSPWTEEALNRLETFYSDARDDLGMADVWSFRAERAKEPSVARELAVRALGLRTARTRDPEAAIEAYESFCKSFGASREIHAHLLPLLEQTGRDTDLARVLHSEIELTAEPDDKQKLWLRLAQLQLQRLGDARAAFAALRAGLELNPSDSATSAQLERLLTLPEVRLETALLLETLYRPEPKAGRLKVLETLAEAAPTLEARLAASKEAMSLAEQGLQDRERALDIAARALRLAVQQARPLVREWLVEVQRLAAETANPARRAKLLLSALGEHPVDCPELSELSRLAAAAAAASGDLPRAIDLYRQALAFDPASHELVLAIDELLVQQGAPGERLALYESALARETDEARRRDLLYAIARVQRVELGDLRAAIESLRRAATEDPSDFSAHEALLDALSEAGDAAGASAELERVLPQLEGDRRNLALLRLAESAERAGDSLGALRRYRELLEATDLSDDVLAQVERLALEQSDGTTLHQTLERRLGATSDPKQRVSLLERLGNAESWQLSDPHSAARRWLEGARLAEGLQDLERARRLYDRVLDAEPLHREAAGRILELSAQAGDWTRIPDAFAVMLEGSEARELVAVTSALEPQALENGKLAEFAAMLGKALARPLEAGAKRHLSLLRARVLSREASSADEAYALFVQLFAEVTDDASAEVQAFTEALGRAAQSSTRASHCRWLYQWRAEHARDPVPVLLGWARAEETEFGDLAAALALYERVVLADAEQLDAWTELARLRAALGDPEGALASLRGLCARVELDDRAAVELQIAGLLMDELQRPAEAMALVRPIIAQHPSDLAALRIVHRALGIAETRAEAATLLESAADRCEDPARRADVIEALLAVSAEAPELAQARSRWMTQLLETKMEQPEEALRIALSGAEAAPGEFALWQVAEQMARKLGRPEPVAEAQARAFSHSLPAALADELGRRMVEFHEEWFDAPERVIELLERVLWLCPSAIWAFDRLKLAFNAAGRWSQLFTLYDARLLGELPSSERVDVLREAAMAARDFANEPERAMGYLEALNRLVPGEGRVEASLERLYERHARKRPLIELLSARRTKVGAPERADLGLRMASLWLDLAEPSPALELTRELLLEASHVRDAVQLLERLLTLPQSAEGGADSALLDATQLLKAHYRSSGSVVDVVRMLEIEERVASSVAERRALLEQIVDLRLSELADGVGAFETAAELVLLEPEQPAHRKLFAELASRVGAAARQAEVLVAAAGRRSDAATRAELFNEAAAVHQRALGDNAAAIELYRQVIALVAPPATSELMALRELSNLLRPTGDPAEQTRVLERLAELEDDAAARRAALGEAARLAFGLLADAPRAIVSYRKRIADDRRDLEAMDGLCEALEAAQHWDELISALEARACIEVEAAARRDRVRVARVHAEVRDDSAAAIETWRRLIVLHGADLESFQALSGLLQSEQRWPEVAELINTEIRPEATPERRRLLWLELGALHEQRTLDPMSALDAFVAAEDWASAIRVAGARAPNAAAARRVCERLLELSSQAWKKTAEDHTSAPAQAADWALTELCERLVEEGAYLTVVEQLLLGSKLPFSKRRSRELRREAACLASDRLGDDERAICLFQELLEQDADDESARGSVTRLALLLEEKGRFEPMATLWENQAIARALSSDMAGAQVLWARAGELLEARLGDLDRAVTAYQRGAELGGEACLEALARIHLQEGALELLVSDLERLVAISSGESVGERSLRLAATHSLLGQSGRARQTLEQAVPRVLDGSALRARLAILYREAEDYTALARLIEEEAERAPDRRQELSLLREAADLHLQQRRQPAAAIPLLERAVLLDPDEPKLRLALAQALYGSDRHDEAAVVLEEQLARYGARRPKDRALVHYELARVLLARGEQAAALRELDAASRVDPAHPKILHMLARTALDQGELERAERMYRALLLLAAKEDADAPSRGEALIALGEIAAQRGDALRADEFLSSAFETALGNPREAQRLEQALRGRARPQLFARVLELRLEQGISAQEAARCLADLTDLHASMIGDLDAARDSLSERARAIQAELEKREVNDDGSWAALGRVYAALGDSEAEARILERRVDAGRRSSRPAPDPDLYYRLAEVRFKNVDATDSGLDLIERALDAGLELDRAEQILRAAFSSGREPPRAIELLERLARARGDLPAVVAIIERRLAHGAADMGTLREGLALAEQMEAPNSVEQLLASAVESRTFRASPADLSWMKLELARHRRARGEIHSALELEEQAAGELLPSDARALLLGVARESLALGDVDRGSRVLAALHLENPEQREVWEPLLDLYRATDQPEQLVKLLEATAPVVTTQEERTRLRVEQAETLMQVLGRREDAIRVLKELVADDPSERQARLQLSDLLKLEGREEELIELLLDDLAAVHEQRDSRAVSALTLRLVALLERHARQEEALEACRAALQLEPTQRELLETQLRLAKASGDSAVLAEALEGLLRVERGAAAAALCKSLASVREEQQDDAGVERALELGFAACPGDTQICQRLAARYQQRGEPGRVAQLLERAVAENPNDRDLFERWIQAYRQAGQHEPALAAMDRYLGRKAADAVLYRMRAGLLTELGRDAEAVADLERAAQSDPSVVPELIQALERAIERAEPDESAALLLRLVDVLEQANDVAAARLRLEELVRDSPRDRALILRLAELQRKQGLAAAAAQSYESLVELESGERLVSAALALSELCEQSGNTQAARAALQRARVEDPQNAVVRARLVSIVEAAGDQAELAELLYDDADRETRPAERLSKLLRVGELMLAMDANPEQSIVVLESARAEAADSIEATVLLARAYTRAGRIEDALGVLNTLIDVNRGKRTRAVALLFEEKANVHLEEGFLTDALTALTKAFELDAKNARLGIRLGQLALESEEDEIALRALRGVAIMKAADVDGVDGARPETKAEANYGLALLAQRAGDPRKVRVLVSKALSENPDHAGARTLLDELDGR